MEIHSKGKQRKVKRKNLRIHQRGNQLQKNIWETKNASFKLIVD